MVLLCAPPTSLIRIKVPSTAPMIAGIPATAKNSRLVRSISSFVAGIFMNFSRKAAILSLTIGTIVHTDDSLTP